MKFHIKTFLAGGAPFALILAASPVANATEAELSSCGGVFLSGDASCEYVKLQDCEDHCEVVSVQQSCAAELYASCETECSATASASCVKTCEPVCVDECITKPATTSGSICRTDCSADCDAKCEGSKDGARCHASCSASCSHRCKDRCHEDDETVECTPKCTTACDGTCTATATSTCQIDCQTNYFQSCETTVVEQCRTDCTDRGGAIFCNGQFMNAANVEDCANELSANFAIHLDVSATVDVSGGIDTNGDGEDDSGCSFSAAAPHQGSWAALGAVLAGAALLRRRQSPRAKATRARQG